MTEYITKPGDRWDLIAFKAYGTIEDILLDDGTEVNAISHILSANPDIIRDSVIAEGILLQIPTIPTATVKTNTDLLPPWKR